jgi:competence protein ComEC
MNPISGVILCLAYILGLLSTSVAGGSYGILALGIATAILVHFGKRISYRNKLTSIFWLVKPQIWLAAGVVGFVATIYLQVRTPHPEVNDISKFVTSADVKTQAQVVTVQGKVASTPRLTRSQRGQFWLEVNYLHGNDVDVGQEVTGKLYVTMPLLQVTGLHEGEAIAVTGSLYKPKPGANPGAFDFQAYLAQEGGFASLKGREVSLVDTKTSSTWGWWAIRRRIIRSQVQWLGVPEGPLASAMVLGNRVVDVPFNISDSFVKVGLAHALAASGFQVSLILGVVLSVARRFSSRVQFSFGVTALLIFVGLTGPQPSVLRAVLMGIGALTALVLQRKVKPLGLILLAANLLLIFNPVWIWNLGFEFSFLATLGLVVTVPALMKRLGWLPPVIATLVAVPIAAYVWTLPLQVYIFGWVSPYSILVNIITTIPLSIISLGAFISAIAALISPIVGSALASLLYYPTHGLIAVIELFSHLPGTTVAVGTMSELQLIAIYGLLALVCIQNWWQQRWWIAGLMATGLVLIPVWQTQTTIFRITVLASATKPVLIIQDQGKVLLVNNGDRNNARFTVLPFLQQQGVNQIDWAIAANSLADNDSGWLEIMQSLPVKNFYDCSNQLENQIVQNAVRSHNVKSQHLSAGQMIVTGSTSVELLNASTPMLQLKIKDRTWLILGEVKPDEQKQLALSRNLLPTQVLLWSGESLEPDLIKTVKPEVAIASAPKLDRDTMSLLSQAKAKVLITGRDGAVQWTPKGKFETTIETVEDKASSL